MGQVRDKHEIGEVSSILKISLFKFWSRNIATSLYIFFFQFCQLEQEAGKGFFYDWYHVAAKRPTGIFFQSVP